MAHVYSYLQKAQSGLSGPTGLPWEQAAPIVAMSWQFLQNSLSDSSVTMPNYYGLPGSVIPDSEIGEGARARKPFEG